MSWRNIVRWFLSLFPLWSSHTINNDRLKIWRDHLTNLVDECHQYVINVLNDDLKKLTVEQKITLERFSTLLSEWSGNPKTHNEFDLDTLKTDPVLEHSLSVVDSIDDRKNSLEGYLLFTRVFRHLKGFHKFHRPDADEISAYVLSRLYRPTSLTLSDLDTIVYLDGVHTECCRETTQSAVMAVAVKRLYRYAFYGADQIMPTGCLALLNSIGCLLMIRYRLSGLLGDETYKPLNTHMTDLLSHLTTGVPHVRQVHQKESTSRPAHFRARVSKEECRRDQRRSPEIAQARLYSTWHN